MNRSVHRLNNVFQIQASIVSLDAVRYTPAGIPLLSLQLFHVSDVVEAGINRHVEFELAAIVVGDLINKIKVAAIGQLCEFSGFMAKKTRNSRGLIFHISEFELLSTDSTRII